jgi:hypothetical protein
LPGADEPCVEPVKYIGHFLIAAKDAVELVEAGPEIWRHDAARPSAVETRLRENLVRSICGNLRWLAGAVAGLFVAVSAGGRRIA